MCVTVPPQVGCIEVNTEFGRLEHVKGANGSKNCRWRAFRYLKTKDGSAYVDVVKRRGARDEVVEWFKGWIGCESVVSLGEAKELCEAYEARQQEAKEEKMEEKSYEALVKELREVKESVTLIALAIDQSFGPLASALRELSVNGIAVKQVAEPVVQQAVEAVAEDKPKKLKPREATADDIVEFADGVDVLDVVNMRTKMVYAKFVDWCRERGIDPCTLYKMSMHLSKAKGLVCKDHYFRKADA